MAEYEYPTWDEAPAIGKPKKKKPHKRAVGPTVEATKYGLAGPSEYTQAPEISRPVPTQSTMEALTPAGAAIAENQIDVLSPQSLNMTLEELQTRSINLAYFKHTHMIAPPSVVASLLANPATNNLTQDQYLMLFKGAETLVTEQDFERLHPKATQGLEPEYVGLFQNEPEVYDRERSFVMGKSSQRRVRPQDVALEVGQTSIDKVRNDWRALAAMTGPPEDVTALANEADPYHQALALSAPLVQRAVARGGKAEWDFQHPWGDPDFMRAVGIHAMGKSWAYAVLGEGKDQSNARQVFEYMRHLPVFAEAWEEMGRKLNVPMADWNNGNTFDTVLDLMRSTNDDTVKKVIFDNWQFGRQIGTSASQSRAQFANEFGPNQLPIAERKQYDEESLTIPKLIDTVMGAPFRAFDKAISGSPIGPIMAPLNRAMNAALHKMELTPDNVEVEGSMEWLSLPFTGIAYSIAAIYDLSVQAQPDVYDRGIKSQSEYVRAVEQGLMENASISDSLALWRWHWGVFVDSSRAAAIEEENWGRDPFTMAAETMSVESYGEVKPWATETGQLAFMTAMIPLGAKMDTVFRAGAKAAGREAFLTGREAEMAVLQRRGGDILDVPNMDRPIPGGEPSLAREVIPEEIPPEAKATADTTTPTTAPSVPKVNEQGVKVAEIEVKGETVQVDASAAPWLQRLNDNGVPTTQSHSGVAADHPAGHPSRDLPGSVEISYKDIRGADGTSRVWKGRIDRAADAVKAEIERQPGGKTFIVKGDMPAFTDALLGAEGRAEGAPPFVPEGPAATAPYPVPDYAVPLYNNIFRNKAEVIARCPDPVWISTNFDIPVHDNPVVKNIVRKLAAEKNPRKVESLIHKLEEHGIYIDGGESAMIKNMRQRAYRSGFGKRNFLRFFTTPTLYGKTQPIDQAVDSTYNYMVASKLGMEKMTPETWKWITDKRREIWEEDNPNKVAKLVREVDDEIEANIIARDGSLVMLRAYTQLYHRAQGVSMMSGDVRAYFGTGTAQAGTEGSFVRSPSKAKDKAARELRDSKAALNVALKDAKATKKERTRLQEVVDEAEQEVFRVADAIDVVESLGDTPFESLSRTQKTALSKAHNILDDYSVPVPVKLGQHRSHISFRYNPRILASYMAGPTSRALAITDQAVFQPLMTIFKETVMASLGFPIRVNIGDEFIRLIPEGTIKRMKTDVLTAHPLEKLENNLGVDMTSVRTELHDKLAYDWIASDSGSWILVTKGSHPKYYEYLGQDLKSWAAEPIVQKLIERNGGTFPRDPGDIKAFIEELMAEDTPLAWQIREFLEDTYRYGKNGVDKVAFDEWCGLWQDRMDAIARSKVLRQSMTAKGIDVEMLKTVKDEYLWPVNAPEQAFIGANRNPLVQLSRLNPYHYVYNGVKVPFSEMRIPGSLQLLGVMSNWMRETVFSDRYYMERDAELARAPNLAKTPEGMAELHQVAAERAMRYTNKVTYSRSSTMFEDMTRNLIPFGNAYRQFWVYWGAAFAKHPFAISAYTAAYRKLFEDQFLNWGDYQMFVPGVPFFAASTEDEGTGMAGLIKGNLPQASFLVTGPARTLMGAMGIDPEERSKLPMMSGLSTRMSPFSRQARLQYAVLGWAEWDNIPVIGDSLVSLFGDPARLEKASINSLLGQLHYKEGELTRDKPWWWHILDVVTAHPEAMFAEIMKQTPNPGTVTYSPQESRDKSNLTFEYFDAITKGQTVKAAQIRADNPWLDRYQSFYDATEEEKVAMKLDPANKDMLKWWVSAYNYDSDGRPYDGLDWQQQFAAGKVSYKKEAELEVAIHNAYVDVLGGAYLPQTWNNQVIREGGVQYAGDAPREEARKRTIRKITKALNWAKGMARQADKAGIASYDRLMYQFQHPDEEWGIWPSLIEANGLVPADYNVHFLANIYFDKFADEAYPTSKDALEAVRQDKYGKIKPQVLSSADALRALDMAEWIADPRLAKKFLSETPYAGQIAKTKNEQRDAIFKAAVDTSIKNWYFIGSQTLQNIGIPASPKLDVIQNALSLEYEGLKKYTVGSSEYKAARNSYWAHRDALLKGVKGGDVITGGVADRLIAIPFVLTPKVTGMGTGKGAVKRQESYDAFMRSVKRELAKEDPKSEVIDKAWQAVDWNAYKGKQQTELARVAAWSFLLAEAKWRRHDMRTHYSDYYDAPGESAAGKYGSKHVDALNESVRKLRHFSPAFAREIDAWFDSDTNLGTRFLDWYAY